MKDADGNELHPGDLLYSTDAPNGLRVLIEHIDGDLATLSRRDYCPFGSNRWRLNQRSMLSSNWRKSWGDAGADGNTHGRETREGR